jgi:hypothetical protein
MVDGVDETVEGDQTCIDEFKQLLLFSLTSLAAGHCQPDDPTSITQVASIPTASALRLRHPDTREFVAWLWNDEVHSFNDVIDQVTEATSCDTDKARQMAEHVDTHVRAA